jgi:hypothetical protein
MIVFGCGQVISDDAQGTLRTIAYLSPTTLFFEQF